MIVAFISTLKINHVSGPLIVVHPFYYKFFKCLNLFVTDVLYAFINIFCVFYSFKGKIKCLLKCIFGK